jgi:hypothetical protein
MTNDPTVAPEHTFVVMAHGDSPYLPECLDTLLCQTVPSAICIATSTPSDYLRAQARRIGAPLVETESGRGIAHDWNFALRQAKTKYVTLAHQDDRYAPAYVARCLDAVKSYPDTLLCFTDYTELVGPLERTDSLLLAVKRWILRFFMPFRRLKSSFWKTRLLSLGCPIAAPSVFYQINNLGDFQFSPDFSVNMDWDAWSRIALLDGYFIFVPQKLMQHRIHPDSATTLGIAAMRRQEEDARMFRRFWPAVVARVLTRCYAMSYRSNKISD